MDKLEYIPGDLVIYASLIKEPVAEICEVHEASYTIKFMHGNFAKVTSKEIKPITLTSEILEKNGWKKGGYGFYIKDNFPFLIYKDVDSFNVKIDEFKEDTFIKLSYCHQLQHLLFGLGLNHEMEV